MQQESLRLRYVRRLESWPAAMRRYLYRLPGRPDLGCYGPGDHGHWAMQANNTAAAAFSVLATDPALDPERADMSRDEMLTWALRLIRFSLHSHKAGGSVTTDEQPWGHSWISALCLERMMHGVEALNECLTDEDRDILGRVLVSECDWLMDEYHRGATETPGAITAGLVQHNHPENNLWNGCLLHRTARMYPDVERRDEYLEKGTAFLLNGISVEADADAAEVIAGRPLSAWHVGPNFFPSYALNHHGYLNVGYMAICLSNIAMLHFSCRAHGWTAPDGLYHHARELWQLVKSCTFPDGRLWRIGGDTRVRYCYCQDYAVPTWLWARDCLGDTDTEALEAGWLGILETEAEANPDGAFLSARLAELESLSPLYYTRLEGDRAVSMSMGAYWRRQSPAAADAAGATAAAAPVEPVRLLSSWSDDYHGSMMVRGSNRLASWTWRAGQPPQGQCLPPWASSMAEWRGNLAGCVQGLGEVHEARCKPLQNDSFEGGFATFGRVTVHSRQPFAEGDADADVADIDLACVALPDDRTVVVLQRASVGPRTWLRTVKGLFLQVPNDVFNDMQRSGTDEAGRFTLRGCPETAQTRVVNGDWVNLDGCLSVLRVYGPPLVIHQPAQRQIGIRGKERAGGQLYADEICCGCAVGMQAVEPRTVLFDLGVALWSGVDAELTQRLMGEDPPRVVSTAGSDVRQLVLRGPDRRWYRILVNYGGTEAALALVPVREQWPRVLAGGATRRDTAEGMQAVVPPESVVVMGEE